MAKTTQKPEEDKGRTPPTPMAQEGLSPLQIHGLGLLERVMAVRKSYADDPAKDAWLMNAINRSVYAAYLDCVEEGVGESAKEMLRQGGE